MKAALQLDPGLDVVTNRVPNVFIRPQQTGEKIYTERSGGWPQASARTARW